MRSTCTRLLLVSIFGFLALAPTCGQPPKIEILTPSEGLFTQAATVNVTGQLTSIGPASIASLTVNGVPVTPSGGSFSTTVTLTPGEIIQPITAEVVRTNGVVLRDRVTVIQGDSIADGDFSLMGVALRLNDTGLDLLESEITSLVDLDIATLLPPGTLVIDNFCYADSFLGCIGRVDVTVSGSPPPSLGGFGIAIDSQTNSVDADVTLSNLAIRANVDDATGVPLSCTIDISAATTTIDGNYGLQPLAGDPSIVDVFQNGNVSVTFGNFNDSTNCSGLLGGLVEALIGLFIGDIQDLVEPAIEDFLNTPVGGDTPIAGAVQTALQGIEISGPIGTAIGVNLETPLFDVFEDTAGITLDSDARITASTPDPLAPDLTASYHIPEAFPSFSAVTPVGGLPYGLGICISSSAFNQLLRAEIESGLLRTTIEDQNFATFLVDVDIEPQLAPIVTGQTGPFGELADLLIPGLAVTIKLDSTGAPLLELVADARVGLDIALVDGALSFTLGTLDISNIDIEVIRNTTTIPDPVIIALLGLVIPDLFPELASSLASFPLPSFLGLDLTPVEISRNGEFMSIFADLTPASP